MTVGVDRVRLDRCRSSGPDPSLVSVSDRCSLRRRVVDRVELGRAVHHLVPGLGLPGRPGAGPGRQHRRVGVDQTGALLLGRGARCRGGEMMICLTTAGVGRLPPWACCVGLDDQGGDARGQRATTSLVPPGSSTEAGLPGEVRAGARTAPALGVHSAQLRSPGATTSTVAAGLVEAARAEGADVVVEPALHARQLDAADAGLGVGPVGGAWRPAEMTAGSVAGEPMVLVTPASPVDTVTVTPAATASRRRPCLVRSRLAVVGEGVAAEGLVDAR